MRHDGVRDTLIHAPFQTNGLAGVMGILKERTLEADMKRRQPALRHQPTEEQLRTVNNIFSLIESIGNSRATLLLALEEEMQKVYYQQYTANASACACGGERRWASRCHEKGWEHVFFFLCL